MTDGSDSLTTLQRPASERTMPEAAVPAAKAPTWFGRPITPLTARRLANFRANRRGYWSFWIFMVLFVICLFAEFVANDRPLVVSYDGTLYFPILEVVPETEYGGFFETEAEYSEPEVQELIEENGWILWPLIPFSYDTFDKTLTHPAPSPPDGIHWLGTDDGARDVIAGTIYGFRISVLFGLLLTFGSMIVGIFFGAIQGYFGGLLDLSFQRFVEIWAGMPVLFLLIILAGDPRIEQGFWTVLVLLLLFSWMGLQGLVRAEFLRGRNFDYVRAARALGVGHFTIMRRHVLPNAMVATLTMLPFTLSGAITSLTALDYLGFGLPPGSPSLGDLLAQGKANLQAPWLGITAFFVLALMLALLVFIGEAVRDAFDPRKTIR